VEMIQSEPEDIERIRERLRKMSDLELRKYGRAARDLSDPKKNYGKPNPSFKIQLDEAALSGEEDTRGNHLTRVGSRTGAVFRRLSLAVAPRFLWECLNSQTVNPFPAPATSHPACGFPALGAPVCLVSRVMGPMVLGRLSQLTIDGAGSR
jgi:hypothetical protein